MITKQIIFIWIATQVFIIDVWLFVNGEPIHPLLLIPSWIVTVLLWFAALANLTKEYSIAYETNDYQSTFNENFENFYNFWIKIIGLITLTAFWVLLDLSLRGIVPVAYSLFPIFFGSTILFFIGLLPLKNEYLDSRRELTTKITNYVGEIRKPKKDVLLAEE